MPHYNLTVHGSQVRFLVDSGATHSLIKMNEFPSESKVKLSGNFVNSVGASGNVVRERFTVPLRCEDATNSFKHAFLLSACCPVNLLGRDLMIRLGIGLVSTSEGVKTVKNDDSQAGAFVKYSPEHMLYAYQWKLSGGELSELTSAQAKECTSPLHTEYWPQNTLQCTTHISPGPDQEYEKLWYHSTLKNERLTVTHLFWTEHRCVAEVQLTPTQQQMFLVHNSSPHIPLSKREGDQWEDLGQFTKMCNEISDWEKNGGSICGFQFSNKRV